MAKKSLIKLLLCLAVVIATVGMAAANGPEIMVYSGTIPQGVSQGDGTYEISFSIYASEKGGSALWTETQNVYVYQGTFAVYLGAVEKLNLAFDLPYWVGVKVGDKEDIWPLTGAGYPLGAGAEATLSAGTGAPSLAIAANEVLSANIKEADNSSGQNTNSGAGIKTGHIQNSAITTAKIKKEAILSGKIAPGAVTDEKITGPISASKISSVGLDADTLDGFHSTAFVKKAGDTMTGPLAVSIPAGADFPEAIRITGFYGASGVGRSIIFGDAADYVRLRDVVEASGQVGFSIDTAGDQSRLYINHGGNVGIGTTSPAEKLDVAGNITATGSVTAASFSGVSITACPAGDGYTQIEFANSTLCIRRTLSSNIWNNIENICFVTYTSGQLCTHQQVRRACKHGGFALTTGTWMADRVSDDFALYVNIADCDNFDGSDNANSALHQGYCCLEWMKY